jgi:hypothetical protein
MNCAGAPPLSPLQGREARTYISEGLNQDVRENFVRKNMLGATPKLQPR